jgi:glutaminase
MKYLQLLALLSLISCSKIADIIPGDSIKIDGEKFNIKYGFTEDYGYDSGEYNREFTLTNLS